jgi:ADP-ribose pyrophosphatase
MQPFKLIGTTVVYRGRAFDVCCDEVRLPDGKVSRLDIVKHRGAVTLLPVDQSGRIWFVRQYRHAAQQTLLELPAGGLEAGEAPELAARRELREEIGFSAGEITKIGEFFLAPGYSTEKLHIFMATDLRPDPLPGDEDEFLSAVVLTAEETLQAVSEGEIRDAKTLATFFLARPYLNLPEG